MARRHGRTTCLFVLAGLVALALSAPASASAATKPYELTISPWPNFMAGGQYVTITATFTNKTGPPGGQQIGSANLFWPTSVFGNVTASVQSGAPAGATATVPPTSCTFGTLTGPCIQLRNLSLQPSQSLTVTISATTQTCSTASKPWVVEAKQANDFSGPPGNDLTLATPSSQLTSTLDGACNLAWRAQPADSLTNNPISSVPFTPGSPISVRVIDSQGKVVQADGSVDAHHPAPTITLTPSNPAATLANDSVPAQVGIALFPALTINTPGDFYTLLAKSGTLPPVTSNAFDVADTYTFSSCSVTAPCSAKDSNPVGSGQVVASATAGTLTLSINSNNGNTLPCAGYVSADQNVYGFDGPGSKIGTITITNPNTASPTLTGTAKQVLSAQQICFDGPVQFTTLSGAPALPDGTGGFIGLLPACAPDPDNWDDPEGDADDPTSPCHIRQLDTTTRDPASPLGYDIHLVAYIPEVGGDPHFS